MDSQIQKIVMMYRAQQSLNQEQFAEALTADLVDESLSKMTISHWEAGSRKPNPIFCIRLSMKYDDWRADLAFDLLAAMIPDAYKPKGTIGKHVLLGEPAPSGLIIRMRLAHTSIAVTDAILRELEALEAGNAPAENTEA